MNRVVRLLALGVIFCGTAHAVGEPKVKIQTVGIENTSFPQLLWLHVRNQTYVPLNLADLMAASQLLIDGQPTKRAVLFTGPGGITAAGEWDGCLSYDDYAPKIKPGKHKLRIVVGGVTSNETSVTYSEPLNWRQGNLKSRTQEIHALAKAIPKDMPRSCVEQWLTTPDGGPPEPNVTRYYLDPGFKMVVPYSHNGEAGRDQEQVTDKPQVFQEARTE